MLGHPKTREAIRAGLAMFFVTLDDEELREVWNLIVGELRIDPFFIFSSSVTTYPGEPANLTIIYQDA